MTHGSQHPPAGAAALPQYDRPPLTEVAFAVQFRELSGLTQVDLGLFWQQMSRQFPQVRDKPRLDPMTDPLEQTQTKAFEIKRVSPVHRVWFMSSDNTRLVQLQPDRFVMNWRHKSDGAPYPRFDNLIGEFETHWAAFQAFLSSRDLGEPHTSVIELLYVNIIDVDSLDELLKPVQSATLLPPNTPTTPQASLRLAAPIYTDDQEPAGSLRITAEPIASTSPHKFKMDLTARLRVQGGNWAELSNAFSLGRKVIVSSFDHLTEEALHEQWGRSMRA